jgi:hypothetical protein
MVLALVALGVSDLVRRVARAERLRLRTPVVVATAFALLVVPVVESVSDSVATARIHPEGPQVLPSLMASHGLSGPIVSTGVGEWEYSYYLPSVKVSTSSTPEVSARTDTIVVAKPQCRDPLDASVRALVAVNQNAGHLWQIYSDPAITVYAVTSTLRSPSAADVADQPPSRPVDGC